MLNKLLLGLFFVIFSSCGTNYKSKTSINLKHSIPFSNKIVLQKLNKTDKVEESILSSYLLYNNSKRVLIFLFLVTVLLFIIAIPVIIFYNLLTNIFEFKKYHKNVQFKKLFLKYKQTRNNIYGNSAGFLTWIILTLLYILKNYKNISVGLKDYFSLPFKFFKNITLDNQKILDNIPLTIWISMLLIVSISIFNYVLGKYLGSIIINRKYKKSF